MTIQTCTTADLDRLCRQYSNPRTLEESAILKGVKAELADRKVATRRPYASGLYEAERAIDREIRLLRA